jgi:hypothetical protein
MLTTLKKKVFNADKRAEKSLQGRQPSRKKSSRLTT